MPSIDKLIKSLIQDTDIGEIINSKLKLHTVIHPTSAMFLPSSASKGGEGISVRSIASLWGGNGAVYMVADDDSTKVRVCVKHVEIDDCESYGTDFGDRFNRTATSYQNERKFYELENERLLAAGK